MNDNEKEQLVGLWINQIIVFIYNLDISDELKSLVRDTLLIQKDLIANGMATDSIFGAYKNPSKIFEELSKECMTFIMYLHALAGKKGKEYFETAIHYALTENPNIGFLDNFIKFVVVTNYNDIEISENIDFKDLLEHQNDFDHGRGCVQARLGGLLLCDLSQFSAHDADYGHKYLDFYNFHSRKNLTRTRIGPLLVKRTLQIMMADEELREYSLGSKWVMKNNALGKKFYKKTGFKFTTQEGEFVDYSAFDDFVKVRREDYPDLSETELYYLRQKMGGNFGVIIPSEEKQTVLETPIEIPYIELDGERIDCTTDFSMPRGM